MVPRTLYEVPITLDPVFSFPMTQSPLRIGHRGIPALTRENTLTSFELALQCGADGIELDVHATSDHRVVVHHDPVLENSFVIADETLADLRMTRTRSALPELGDVRRLMDGRGELFVEIKGPDIERLVLHDMQRYDAPFALHSFDHAMIARIHDIAPNIRLGVLLEELPTSITRLMREAGARDVWPQVPIITPQLVHEVHAAGGRVVAWTVNDADVARQLASMDVDGLCGDDVRIFSQL